MFTRRSSSCASRNSSIGFAARMRTEIAEVALRRHVAGAQGAALGDQHRPDAAGSIKAAKAVGRLVINLKAAMRTMPGSSDDVILRNGDELIVPKQRQEVMVLGEVQDPTSHLYQRRMSRDDYIDQSGGPTRQADRKHIYVVRADGSVDSGPGLVQFGDSVDIRPGDAIVVPLDTERLPALTVDCGHYDSVQHRDRHRGSPRHAVETCQPGALRHVSHLWGTKNHGLFSYTIWAPMSSCRDRGGKPVGLRLLSPSRQCV